VGKYLLLIALSISLFADDVMVERMQSIVDEVTELRSSYELSEKRVQTCQAKLNSQDEAMKKLSHSEGFDYKDFEKNRKEVKRLEAENRALKSEKSTKRELETLEKENQRLTASARILIDKNHKLLSQVNKYKQSNSGEIKALELELKSTQTLLKNKKAQNSKLQKELMASKKDKNFKQQPIVECKAVKPCPVYEECPKLKPCTKIEPCPACKKCKKTKVSKAIKSCKDDNPFPKLMPKESKEVKPVAVIKVEKVAPAVKKEVNTSTSKKVVSAKASAYRLKQESAVYDSINGKVLAVWEEKTSFTSNITQGKWVKITGFFVEKKWQKAKQTLWIEAKNTIRR